MVVPASEGAEQAEAADVARDPRTGSLMATILELTDVVKLYGQGETTVRALDGVSLSVESGDYVAVIGASGSGKSTLMNIVGCLDIPTLGSYHLDGIDVADLDDGTLAIVRNRKLGFVFQSFNLIPRTTALANVELPLSYAGIHKRERRERAEAALEMVGLAARAHHRPNELSGGEQQRVAIARALVTTPSVVLADEPTGNLDSHSTEEILAVFDHVSSQGRTIVMITHETDVAARAKRTLRMRDGRILGDRRNAPIEPPPGELAGSWVVR